MYFDITESNNIANNYYLNYDSPDDAFSWDNPELEGSQPHISPLLSAPGACSIELDPLAEEILAMEESSEGLNNILESLGYATAEDLLRAAVAADSQDREELGNLAVATFSDIYAHLIWLEEDYGYISELVDKVRLLRQELASRVASLGEELGPQAQAITDEIQGSFADMESYQPAPAAPEPVETEVCVTSSGLEYEYVPQLFDQAEEAPIMPNKAEAPAEPAEPVAKSEPAPAPISPGTFFAQPDAPTNDQATHQPQPGNFSADAPWGPGEIQHSAARMLDKHYDQVARRLDRAAHERQPGEIIREA